MLNTTWHIFSRSLVYVLRDNPWATRTSSPFPCNEDCAPKEGEKISCHASTSHDEPVYRCWRENVRKTLKLAFLRDVKQHIHQELLGELVFLERQIKIDSLGIIAKLHSNWWVAMLVAVRPMTNGAYLQPQARVLGDAMEIVDDESLICSSYVIEIIQCIKPDHP